MGNKQAPCGWRSLNEWYDGWKLLLKGHLGALCHAVSQLTWLLVNYRWHQHIGMQPLLHMLKKPRVVSKNSIVGIFSVKKDGLSVLSSEKAQESRVVYPCPLFLIMWYLFESKIRNGPIYLYPHSLCSVCGSQLICFRLYGGGPIFVIFCLSTATQTQ